MPLSSPNEASSREMTLKIPKKSINIPLWTALVTPFTECGSIDYSSLARIAQQQAAAGNGLLLLGSTGEALSLTSEQQLNIVLYVCKLGLDVPIMVGVGGFQLKQQIEWIECCNALPIDAYLLGTPLYAKPSAVGQERWFDELLNVSKKPCMLYNIPSRSGISLSPHALANLQQHENCWALKEASGDIEQFLAYKQACPELKLYSGEDSLMPYLATAGAQGLVSVCANAWPDATQLYVKQCLLQQAGESIDNWRAAISVLFSVANPIPIKILMHEIGDIDSPSLQPPLTHEELTNKQALLDANDAINNWFWQQTQPAKQQA